MKGESAVMLEASKMVIRIYTKPSIEKHATFPQDSGLGDTVAHLVRLGSALALGLSMKVSIVSRVFYFCYWSELY